MRATRQNAILALVSEYEIQTQEELSEKLGTICYELTSTVGERVPRIYVENGKIVKTIN